MPESLLAQSAQGLVQVQRFNEAAFAAMCQLGYAALEKTSHSTVRVSAPVTMHAPADDEFQDESYRLDSDYQFELYAVFRRFCSNVTRQSRQSSDGLFVYGDAGTGKTHLSQTAVAWLKSKGLKVLEFSFDESPLSEDFYVKLLESSIRSNSLYDETADVVAYLETHHNLSQHDIFYIDDTNKKLSKLGKVTKALLHYALKQGKTILINSNQSPEEMLPSSLTEHISCIQFHEVRGSDYRQSQAWYKQVNVERLQSSDDERPFIIDGNFVATEPQMAIKFWVNKLMQQDKSNGLVIVSPPGTGKSTVLKYMLASMNALYLLRTDLLAFDFSQLNQSEIDVLVIEDINDISWRGAGQRDVFNRICNGDEQSLKNKHGKPIKLLLLRIIMRLISLQRTVVIMIIKS